MKRTFTTRAAAILAGAGLVAGLAACSSDSENAAGAEGGNGDIKIVASTKVWSDIADAVTDDEKVSIEPIIANNDIDPHSYEPSAADMAKVEGADILLGGGGDYDAWLVTALGENPDKTVISALDFGEGHHHDHAAEGHNHEGEHADEHAGHDHEAESHNHEAEGHNHEGEVNEHIWYDTEKVDEVAHKLVDALKEKGAEADAEGIHKELKKIDDSKSKIKAAKVAQIHPLADDILDDTKVEDITPEGYRTATLNESEPSAADVNAMMDLINSGKLDYIIDAPQTHDQVSERLIELAQSKGLKIVNVYEAPAANETYFDLYKRALKDMENIK